MGTFPMEHVTTQMPGYGGDVIVFKEEAHSAYALHRVWLGSEARQHRWKRIHSPDASERKSITNGCINLLPETYVLLRAALKAGEKQVEVVKD